MKNELIVKNKPKSIISEDIRTIRTNLEFLLTDNESKTFMITSSVPGEGKSFISSNLAVAFAQYDKKVLIIDCDMRLGRTHKIFELSNKNGLSNLIAKYDEDETALEEYIQKTEVKNLYVLPRGVVPPNPSELLSSKRFEVILKKLQKIFDYIILDSVPTNGLPDALVLSKLVDKTLIVSKYGYTDIADLEATKKALENVNANIAGVVINKVPKTRSKYGNYYYAE